LLGDFLTGAFTLFIAWYLWSSGQGHVAMTQRRTALELVPLAPLVQNQLRLNADWPLVYAADVMTLNLTFIAPVMKDAQVVGVFLLDHLAGVPRLNWGTVRVGHLMRPLGGVPKIDLNSNVFQALLAIEQADTHYALVTSEGGPVGVAARRDLIHLARQYGD
jgi:predicted transcriptional regulator